MTAPYYSDETVSVHHGDALDVLRSLPDCSVDAVVTDPPAAISFMGRSWDGDRGGRAQWTAWLGEVMAEALRVAKPGSHAFVWALPRTSHWTACAVEDAGWIIRDRCVHLFGSGFPKSLDVAKAITATQLRQARMGGDYTPSGQQGNRDGIGHRGESGMALGDDPERYRPAATRLTGDAQRWDGWGTALKPAAEDWWLARKPLSGTVAGNVLEWGTGALNIDACRVEGTWGAHPGGDRAGRRAGVMGEPAPRLPSESNPAGRWPTNVTLNEHAAAELDRDSGQSTSPPVGSVARTRGGQTIGTFAHEGRPPSPNGHGDSGGASRYFPVFKYEPKAPTSERPRVDGEAHATVKPLDLMRWLVRLVTPPGGTVLDPFAGSGTTAEACVVEGFRCITVEREAAYLPLIVARLSKPIQPVLGDL